jgi:hypothetical protein
MPSHSGANSDVVESKMSARRPSPLPGGERSGRACAIRVRGNGLTIGSAVPSPGMCAREARTFRPLPSGER